MLSLFLNPGFNILYYERAKLRYPFSYWITPNYSSITVSYIVTARRVPVQDKGLQKSLREKEELVYTSNLL